MAEKHTRRADGRLKKTVNDPYTGRRIYFYGKTEKELNRKILEYREQTRLGRSFREVADAWWEQTEPTLSPNSIHTYRVAMNRAIEEFGNERLRNITTRTVQLFITRFAGTGSTTRARKTVSNQLMIVSQIFKYGICEGDCDLNPAQSVTIPRGLKTSKRTAASSLEEEIIKNSPDVWLFPYFVLYTRNIIKSLKNRHFRDR